MTNDQKRGDHHDEERYYTKLGKVTQTDEERIQDELGEMARGSVEDPLNGLLDAEADHIYEHSPIARTPAPLSGPLQSCT